MSEMSKTQKIAIATATSASIMFAGCAGMQSQPMTPEREHCREMTSNVDYMSTLRNAGWGGLAGAAAGAAIKGPSAIKGAAAGAALGAVIDLGMQYTENSRLENECVRNYGSWTQKYNEYQNQGAQPVQTQPQQLQRNNGAPPARNNNPAPRR